MQEPVWYTDPTASWCIGHTGGMVLLGNMNDHTFKFFNTLEPLSKLMAKVWPVHFYAEDMQRRFEFDGETGRAYRQRPATDADRADEDLAERISADGWIDEHEEVIDSNEGALIGDLFEVRRDE